MLIDEIRTYVKKRRAFMTINKNGTTVLQGKLYRSTFKNTEHQKYKLDKGK